MEFKLIFLFVALIKLDVITGQARSDLNALFGGQGMGSSTGLSSLFGTGGAPSSGLSSLFGSGASSGMSSLFGSGASPSSGMSSLFGAGTPSASGLGSPFGGGGVGGLVSGMGKMIGAQLMIDRKRKLFKRYIELYENEGCVDPFDKLPATWRAMAARNLVNGCGNPQANFTCQLVQYKVVKPRMMMMQNQLRNSPITQGLSQASAWKALSAFGLQGGGISGILKMMVLGSGTGPLASSIAGITEMAERQGEIRQRLLPLQCQDIRHQMMPSLTLSICCPGQVTIPDSIQFMAMQGQLRGL